MAKIQIVAGAWLMACLMAACSVTIERCETYYSAGEYAHALECLRPLAEQGNSDAQYRLGILYRFSLGVPKSLPEYERWIREAARQGHGKAQEEMGFMYALGRGVYRDLSQAAFWFHKAALQGRPESQYLLAVALINGEGGPRDRKQGLMWLRKAALAGNFDAQYLLGRLYLRGVCVQKDIVMAHVWYSFAARDYYGEYHKDRDALAETMTQEELERAEKIRSKLWERYFSPGICKCIDYKGELD